MTKDKERDDALIAEAERLTDMVYNRDDEDFSLHRDCELIRLARENWQPTPEPDRAEVLARDVLLAWSGYQQLTDEEAGSEEFAKACRFTQTAIDELRAEWEAERPAVVVPGEVLEQARANRYTPVGSVRIMARFILSLDGAKGGE